MGKHNKYKNGDIVYLYEDEYEIIDYINSKNVIIKSISTGKEVKTRNEILQCKRGKGTDYKPKRKRNPTPVVGQRFITENHGWATVLDIYGYKMTIKFDNTGAIKSDVYRTCVYSGKVADNTIGNSTMHKFREKFKIGSVHPTKLHGDIEIVEVINSKNMTIKWLDTGRIQFKVYASDIRNLLLKDSERKNEWDYLGVGSNYYIYGVKFNNEIIYIGKGIGKRYLHVKSGSSHNRELNRIYFCNENSAEVFLILGGIKDSEQVDRLEKEFIIEFNPKYNSKVCSSEYD